MLENYPQTAQGPAVPANEQDLAKDAFGITDPNLHRRLSNGSYSPPVPPPPPPPTGPYQIMSEDGFVILSEDGFIILSDGVDEDEETLADITEVMTDTIVDGDGDVMYPSDYVVSVAGVNSFRLTKHLVHDEDSTTDEVP